MKELRNEMKEKEKLKQTENRLIKEDLLDQRQTDIT